VLVVQRKVRQRQPAHQPAGGPVADREAKRQLAHAHQPVGERLDESIDTLVSAVGNCIESWGMAAAGMYWRPVLQVSVAPGAEPRFEELRRLLDGSGLAVERR
jgi:hypothetical protein